MVAVAVACPVELATSSCWHHLSAFTACLVFLCGPISQHKRHVACCTHKHGTVFHFYAVSSHSHLFGSFPCCQVIDFKESAYDTASKIDLAGHRSDVRCLALSGDDTRLLSGSNSGCKLWDPISGACLGSIDSGYALCCMYAPGNRHALVGTKVRLVLCALCAAVAACGAL